jgi:hypothetical protein
MEEYSHSASLEDLKVLISSLNENNVDYLLIGGDALFAYGYHRATADIGLLVPATREAGENTRQALMVLPDQAAKEIDPTWFEEGENIRVADAFVRSRHHAQRRQGTIRNAQAIRGRNRSGGVTYPYNRP